jgi:hypothetical protein
MTFTLNHRFISYKKTSSIHKKDNVLKNVNKTNINKKEINIFKLLETLKNKNSEVITYPLYIEEFNLNYYPLYTKDIHFNQTEVDYDETEYDNELTEDDIEEAWAYYDYLEYLYD